MKILEVSGLRKQYPGFLLDDVGFSLEEGHIMGLIGRNGAGKTTTLKSIFNLVHPDAGTIRILGHDMPDEERMIKQRLGYVGGEINYYRRKKLRDIANVNRLFYDDWDDEAYNKYMSMFSLTENKTPLELSSGMRMKFSLTLALSHKADLLILDEPTVGLDPVSRAELIEIFLYLKEKGVSILFSTHIISDIEKCADDITYISDGHVIASAPGEIFIAENAKQGHGEALEDIMISYEKEALHEKLID